MKILIVAATNFEIKATLDFLHQHPEKVKASLDFLVTGIGQVPTTYQLQKQLQQSDYELIINVGVAGTLDKKLNMGEVVNVVTEQFGDLGAEENDGNFINFFKNGLIPADDFPFMDGIMYNAFGAEFDFLPQVSGLTINKVHGTATSIALLKTNFEAEVETMEGAAFFYVCLQEKVNFLQIRAISNEVEPRNRANWQIKLAIENLNKVLIEMLENF